MPTYYSNDNIYTGLYTQPTDRILTYSGVVVTKVGENSYEITGYDPYDQTFAYYADDGDILNRKLLVKGVYAPLGFNELSLETLTYGTSKNRQGVIDFLVGYGEYLRALGFRFDEYDSSPDVQENYDFYYAALQFVRWTETANWTDNSFIVLSPFATRASIELGAGYITNLRRPFDGTWSILDKYSNPIDPSDYVVERIGNRTEIKTVPRADGSQVSLYALKLNVVTSEHVAIFDNEDNFGSEMYNPLFRRRKDRLRVNMRRVKGWDGRVNAPGFLVRNNDIVPNLETTADDFRKFHTSHDTLTNESVRETARRQFGYERRDYLNNLTLDDDVSYEFYRGMLRQKGSRAAIDKLLRATTVGGLDSVQVFEEFAFKVGEYGAVDVNPVSEFKIGADEVKSDPLVVELVAGEGTNRDDVIQIGCQDNDKWVRKPGDCSFDDIWPMLDYDYKENYLPSAGFININEEVDGKIHRLFDTGQFQSLEAERNDYVWFAKYDDGDWNILQKRGLHYTSDRIGGANNVQVAATEITTDGKTKLFVFNYGTAGNTFLNRNGGPDFEYDGHIYYGDIKTGDYISVSGLGNILVDGNYKVVSCTSDHRIITIEIDATTTEVFKEKVVLTGTELRAESSFSSGASSTLMANVHYQVKALGTDADGDPVVAWNTITGLSGATSEMAVDDIFQVGSDDVDFTTALFGTGARVQRVNVFDREWVGKSVIVNDTNLFSREILASGDEQEGDKFELINGANRSGTITFGKGENKSSGETVLVGTRRFFEFDGTMWNGANTDTNRSNINHWESHKLNISSLAYMGPGSSQDNPLYIHNGELRNGGNSYDGHTNGGLDSNRRYVAGLVWAKDENEKWYVFEMPTTSLGRNRVIKQGSQKINVHRFENAILHNTKTGQIDADMPLFDPAKCAFPEPVKRQLKYITQYDPARYTITEDAESPNRAGDDYAFNQAQVGEKWWDTSTVRYYDYEQDDVDYRRQNWGKVFPGSSIDVYEWVESIFPPAQYQGDGTPKSLNDYSTQEEYDEFNNQTITRYYFWVGGLNEGLERTILDPTTEGYQWYAPISDNANGNEVAFIVAGAGNRFTKEDSQLAIKYRLTDREFNNHTEWDLISEDYPYDFIPSLMLTNLKNSLFGYVKVKGTPVTYDSLADAPLGNTIRPRSKWFEDEREARKTFRIHINGVLSRKNLARDYPSWETKIGTLNPFVTDNRINADFDDGPDDGTNGTTDNRDDYENLVNGVIDYLLTHLEINKLFFAMIRYVMTEQATTDWIFKTSFIKVLVNEVQREQHFSDDIYKYINEIKPYSSKLRKFIVKKIYARENIAADVRDFNDGETTVNMDNSITIDPEGDALPPYRYFDDNLQSWSRGTRTTAPAGHRLEDGTDFEYELHGTHPGNPASP